MDIFIFLGYEAAASALPLAAMPLLRRASKKKTAEGSKHTSFLAAAVFTLYIIGVMHFTGLVTIYELLNEADPLNRWNYNLTPFSNDIDINAYILNVFMLVPLGFLLPCFCEKARSFGRTVLSGAGFSLFIELTQLLNERRTDIDDLIMNTLGAAVGYLLFLLLDDFSGKKLRRNVLPYSTFVIIVLASFAGRFLLYNEMGLAGALYGF